MPVVDASVVVDWVAPDVDPEGPARQRLADLARSNVELVAPRLMVEEVANALITGIRRGRWDGSAADSAFSRLRSLPVELLDNAQDIDRAWDLSRRYDQHPVYDMLYVALAERLGEQLLTADRRLRDKVASLGILAPDR